MLRTWHLVAGLLLMPLMGQAAVSTWTSASGGAWETGADWLGGVAPSNNIVWITNNLSKTVTISGSTSSDYLTQTNLYVEAPVGYTNTLLLSGNTSPLVVLGDVVGAGMIGYNANRVGSLVINNGWLSTIGCLNVGNNGIGLMTVSNGFWTTFQLKVGTASNSFGKLSLIGGTNMVTSTGVSLQIGLSTGSVGVVDMSGGLLLATNSPTCHIGAYGIGTMTISGGKAVITSLNVGYYASSSGTLNLSGGTLEIASPGTFAAGALSGSTGSVVMTGGVLITTNNAQPNKAVIGSSGVGSMTISNGQWFATSFAVGNNSPTNGVTSKGTLTIAGGEIIASASANAGYVAGASNNTILITGGLLEAATLACPNGGGNIISNAGGVYQFTPATAIVITTNGGPVVLNGGTLSFRNFAGASGGTSVDVRGNQTGTALTNMTFTTGGQNAFRLNNATNATTGQSYTFNSGLGATNYVRLELVSGTTCYRGGSATIGSGGSLLVSNTLVTFISPRLPTPPPVLFWRGPAPLRREVTWSGFQDQQLQPPSDWLHLIPPPPMC